MNMIKKNQSYMYRGCTVEGARVFNKRGSTRDREYTQKLMNLILEYLANHGVKDLQNLIQLPREKKISKKDQIILIIDLEKYVGKDKDIDALLNNRVISKANKGERNILMNYYAFKYPKKTKSFLKKYLPKKFPDIEDMHNLIQMLETNIDLLSNQSLYFQSLFDFDLVDDSFSSILNQAEEESENLTDLSFMLE